MDSDKLMAKSLVNSIGYAKKCITQEIDAMHKLVEKLNTMTMLSRKIEYDGFSEDPSTLKRQCEMIGKAILDIAMQMNISSMRITDTMESLSAVDDNVKKMIERIK